MKILWHSNAPFAPTGYGGQTKIFVDKLVERGHEVTISCFYGLHGITLNLSGINLLPGAYDPWGNDIIEAHALFTESELVVSLIDAWVLNPDKWKNIPWAAWVPIDHVKVPEHVAKSLRDGKAIPIAMSRAGETALKEAGFDPLYVPHAVNPVYFEACNRLDAKKSMGMEGRFVVGVVGANKGSPARKSFSSTIEAFSRFYKRHPEAILYFHAAADTPDGVNLIHVLKLNDVPDECVRFVDPYKYIVGLPETYMRNAYCMMDVLSNPSRGEGFGIPIVEAQACGTPVVVTNVTSMPELCFSGQVVNGTLFLTDQEQYQMVPHSDEIEEAFENIFAGDRLEYEFNAKNGAKNYELDHVYDTYMEPALKKCLELVKQRTDLNNDHTGGDRLPSSGSETTDRSGD